MKQHFAAKITTLLQQAPFVGHLSRQKFVGQFIIGLIKSRNVQFGEVAQHLQGEWVSVYVPTTPNPTSGFFLMMPRADVVELRMSVDEALKYVISMGVVAPPVGRAPTLVVARS